MSEKRFVVFIESKDTCQLYDEETHCFYEIHDSARNVDILCERLNELSTENRQLKEDIMFWKQQAEQYSNECNILQKKTEMDKNDFFISEAKRMRLLAFIEDKALQKEYSEWERRIWYG